jgi:hypothetical protein
MEAVDSQISMQSNDEEFSKAYWEAFFKKRGGRSFEWFVRSCFRFI